MAADSNISSIGRFSSQMLTYLGTQKTVQSVTGSVVNTYKYANGPTFFPSPDSIAQSDLGGGVVGSYDPFVFDSIKCHFLSRNASIVYAETMAAMVIDVATMTDTSPFEIIEQMNGSSQMFFTENSYRAFNNLRDPGNQVGTVTSINNKKSLVANQIRS